MCVIMLHVEVIEFTASKIIYENKPKFISSIRIANLWLVQTKWQSPKTSPQTEDETLYALKQNPN